MQQQAAVNWLKQHPDSYLLVNKDYLNQCFTAGLSLDYDSFHHYKWLLFNSQQLSGLNCIADSNNYDEFTVD